MNKMVSHNASPLRQTFTTMFFYLDCQQLVRDCSQRLGLVCHSRAKRSRPRSSGLRQVSRNLQQLQDQHFRRSTGQHAAKCECLTLFQGLFNNNVSKCHRVEGGGIKSLLLLVNMQCPRQTAIQYNFYPVC